MPPTDIPEGPDYQGVAVCRSDDPHFAYSDWNQLEDPTEIQMTHLVRADEVLVEAGGDPGDGWVPAADQPLDDAQLFARAQRAVPTDKPPSGVPVMEACEANPGTVEPNAVFCSQGLRVLSEPDPNERRIPFRVAPRYQGLAAEEAKPAAKPPVPSDVPGALGRRDITIGVIDTGIAQDPHIGDWLVTGISDDSLTSAIDRDDPDQNGDGKVESPAGHGTFVAGVVALYEPRIRVHVVRAADRQGAVTNRDLATAIDRLTAEVEQIDILNLSLGGWTYKNRPPRVLTRRIDALPDTTVVLSAAGNLNSERLFWPAALERVVGVGAVISDGEGWRRAEYSNWGPWVDAVAHDGGVFVDAEHPSTGGQVSAYYTDIGGFSGWASWRGTSFTTPKVTGRIAHVMAELDVDAPEAWRLLKANCGPAEPHAAFANAVFVPDLPVPAPVTA